MSWHVAHLFPVCGNNVCEVGEGCADEACASGCSIDCPFLVATCSFSPASVNGSSCSAHGSCMFGTGVCLCNTGYAGDQCDQCAPGYLPLGPAGACVFVPGPSCSDGLLNGDEDGVDCGGTICLAGCGAIAVSPTPTSTTVTTLSWAQGHAKAIVSAMVALAVILCLIAVVALVAVVRWVRRRRGSGTAGSEQPARHVYSQNRRGVSGLAVVPGGQTGAARAGPGVGAPRGVAPLSPARALGSATLSPGTAVYPAAQHAGPEPNSPVQVPPAAGAPPGPQGIVEVPVGSTTPGPVASHAVLLASERRPSSNVDVDRVLLPLTTAPASMSPLLPLAASPNPSTTPYPSPTVSYSPSDSDGWAPASILPPAPGLGAGGGAPQPQRDSSTSSSASASACSPQRGPGRVTVALVPHGGPQAGPTGDGRGHATGDHRKGTSGGPPKSASRSRKGSGGRDVAVDVPLYATSTLLPRAPSASPPPLPVRSSGTHRGSGSHKLGAGEWASEATQEYYGSPAPRLADTKAGRELATPTTLATLAALAQSASADPLSSLVRRSRRRTVSTESMPIMGDPHQDLSTPLSTSEYSVGYGEGEDDLFGVGVDALVDDALSRYLEGHWGVRVSCPFCLRPPHPGHLKLEMDFAAIHYARIPLSSPAPHATLSPSFRLLCACA